jgi:hypothetical protein
LKRARLIYARRVAAKPPIPAIAPIARILAVRDTRDRIEVGDRWVPVPGSGDLRPCDRCCREHEIHVDVELSDGRRANVGSGCAKGESMEVQSRLKSAVSAAKTRSRLAAELAVAREEHARATQAWSEVEALSPPPAELLEEIPDPRGVRQIWGMGDAHVWVLPSSKFDVERRQALLSSWRRNRYKEHGFELPPYSYKQKVDDLADRLAKIERKLAALMF